MGERVCELIRVIQKEKKTLSLILKFFANTCYGGSWRHLKIGDVVCWHVTLDQAVLKGEVGKIVLGEFFYCMCMQGSSCGGLI
jgi:hypothetical protein